MYMRNHVAAFNRLMGSRQSLLKYISQVTNQLLKKKKKRKEEQTLVSTQRSHTLNRCVDIICIDITNAAS